MKIPKYSRYNNNSDEEFFSFGGIEGVKISDIEINKWIERCIGELENNDEMEYTFIASGDSKVFVFRTDELGDNTYDIDVCHGYSNCIIGSR